MSKNSFDLIIYFIITVIILTINLITIYFLKYFKINLIDLNYFFIIIFLFFQIFIILYIINNFYTKPIWDLIKLITDFTTWKSKWINIEIKTNQQNKNIRFIFKFLDVILNSLKNIKDEFLSWKSIKWEVQIAKELQEKLLNKKLEKIPSLDIIARSKPAWEVWWDSFDIIKWVWDNYYIYVWDATGHWVWAWFIMVMVNALIAWFAKTFKSWAQILAYTNEILKPRTKSNILMTALMVRWDEINKRLFMTWAWHEYLLIYKNNLKKSFLIKSWWMALWMTKDIHKILKEQEIKFEINDILVLYTDWITESINKPKKDWTEIMFMEQNLQKSVENAINEFGKEHKNAKNVFNNITIELSRFMWYKHTQLDDITLVVVHYKWDNTTENESNDEKNIQEDYITEWNW